MSNFLPKELAKSILGLYETKSYSQEGEDLLLKRVLGNQKKGFYIDVGAHHPVRFSNTYLFYKKGWSGINIDAFPGSMNIFNLLRPRDINIEVPISSKEEELTYHMFEHHAINTFSKKVADEKIKMGKRLVNKVKLKTKTLSEVLKKNLKKNQRIDFMNVDVEGYDLEVLKSNDWEMYRPKYVIAESLSTDLSKDFFNDPVYRFLKKNGYEGYSKLHNSIIYIDKK
jgi:FkbM family methyltransferase